MDTVHNNNKRIAKNTIMLYIRMLVMTLISIYTVRVTLQSLGVEDFGIYNVVCGVVGFLGFISMTLNTSAQRFLALEVGKKDVQGYTNVFSMIMIIFAIGSLIVIILAEIFGPWLITNYLVIPDVRLDAALWIYQVSILSFVIRFLVIPFSASIIAYEEMNIYAYVSILEAVLKLVVVFLLRVSPIDQLIFYALLLLFTDIITSVSYILFCVNYLKTCHLRRYWNKEMFKDMGNFIGWNTFGALSSVFTTQGMSIIINLYFSPAVIASKAISDKVNSFSYSFVANFITASSPQMVKYFSVGDNENLIRLFFRTSKFSFFLMLLISYPLILLMPDLLLLWLSKGLQKDMIIFSQLTLIGTLFSALETPISRVMFATGKVKVYQVVNCLSSLSSIPIVFILFKFGFPPYWAFIVTITIMAISLVYRIIILKRYTNMSVLTYLDSVIGPILLLTILSILASVLLGNISISGLLTRIFVIGLSSIITVAVMIYFVGLSKSERKYIKVYIDKKIRK